MTIASSPGMGRRRVVSTVWLCGLLASCAWSYPADPGQRHVAGVPSGAPVAEADAGPLADADPGARTIYLDRCSQCHEAFDPTYASAAQWPMFVARYGPRAGLYGRDRTRVLAWLQAHAGW